MKIKLDGLKLTEDEVKDIVLYAAKKGFHPHAFPGQGPHPREVQAMIRMLFTTVLENLIDLARQEAKLIRAGSDELTDEVAEAEWLLFVNKKGKPEPDLRQKVRNPNVFKRNPNPIHQKKKR